MPAVVFFCACVLAPARLRADDERPEAPQLPVAATIDGSPIYVGEVESALKAMLQGRQLDERRADTTKAELLEQILDRRLALAALKREGYVSDADLEKAFAKFKTQVEAQKTTVDEYVAKLGVSADSVRNQLAWQLGWPKYAERNLTEHLEAFFKEHHRDYDGTIIRAGHILLRSDRPTLTNGELIKRAEKIREAILAGKISFEDAAKRFSAGPSRNNGGIIGYFPRNGVMLEDFSKAAFALEKGEISEPIVTVFGVHLIRVIEIRPGNKQWTEAVERLKGPATNDLLETLADKERESVKIEFTGLAPYFKPGTKEVVTPDLATK